MIKRIITDEALKIATAMVSEAMLCTLPEPEDCVGQFTPQFDERIERLKKTAERKTNWRKLAKSVVVSVLVVLIGFSMLCVINTEVRATVVTWFKETFETYITYWFNSENENVLPEYELTWVPEGLELVYADSSEHMCIMVYQLDSNASDGFTFDYALANDNSQLTIYSLDGIRQAEVVDINGLHGELYLSSNPENPNALVWFDDEHDIVFTLTSYMNSVDILHIANGVELVN